MPQIRRSSGNQEQRLFGSFLFFFLIAAFLHVILFSIFIFTFPSQSSFFGLSRISFLGSLLTDKDILSPDSIDKKGESVYFEFVKERMFNSRVIDHKKVQLSLTKPDPMFSFTDELNAKPEVSGFFYESKIMEEVFKFNYSPESVPYYQQGFPFESKYQAHISHAGRPVFLKKLLTSGSFDLDILSQRMLRLSFLPVKGQTPKDVTVIFEK